MIDYDSAPRCAKSDLRRLECYHCIHRMTILPTPSGVLGFDADTET